MKLKPLIFDNDSQIRTRSLPITLPLSKKDRETMEYLLNYIRISRDENIAQKYNLRAAVGISAIQIGIAKQLVAISYINDNQEIVFLMINPKIISRSTQLAYLDSGEGCLSVAVDVKGRVYRHAKITVKYISFPEMKEKTLTATGFEAIIIQHEIDHLHGILYYDHIDQNDPYKEIKGALAV